MLCILHNRGLGLCRHAVPVRPSVRLSVTFVYSVETNKHNIFKKFSSSGNHTIQVFFTYHVFPAFRQGSLPNGGVECRLDECWTNAPGYRSITTAVHRSTIHGRRCSSVSQLRCTSVYGTRDSHASVNTPKRSEQKRIYLYAAVKSEPEVTNRRLRSTYCAIKAN